MISLNFLIVAALLGGYLVAFHLRAVPPPPAGWMIGLVHGTIGAAGLLELVVALAGHRPPRTAGLGGFGVGAEVLLALAIALGLLIVASARRGGRPSGLVIGAHASVAITGIVLVLTIVMLR
ncbi:MAG: hypothetical protein ACP5E6_09850 [Acidiphilium sp.]